MVALNSLNGTPATTDAWLKGWDERNGGNLTLRLDDADIAKEPHANQLVFVATVQEEVGLRGARAATATVRPDLGIALEGGITGDVPGDKPEETQVRLGGGPGVFLYDSSAKIVIVE